MNAQHQDYYAQLAREAIAKGKAKFHENDPKKPTPPEPEPESEESE